MRKAAISIVITAVAWGSTACKGNDIERKTEDVHDAKKELQEEKREAKQEIREAKQELQEQRVELSATMQEQLNELEKRYRDLDMRATTATAKLDTTTGPGANIQEERMLAKAKLESAREATSASQIEADLRQARDALDRLEKYLDENDRP